jgi:acyl-CoA thioesterase FadM
MRVWPNDLDMNLHLNNGRYLTLMDIGRFDLTIRAGLLKAMIVKRWLPVLSTASIQFYRSLGPFQKFQLTTKIIYWDEKWLYLSQGYHCHDKVYASAVVKAVFKHGKLTVPVRELFAFLGEEFFLPEMPKDISALELLEVSMDLRRKTMRT